MLLSTSRISKMKLLTSKSRFFGFFWCFLGDFWQLFFSKWVFGLKWLVEHVGFVLDTSLDPKDMFYVLRINIWHFARKNFFALFSTYSVRRDNNALTCSWIIFRFFDKYFSFSKKREKNLFLTLLRLQISYYKHVEFETFVK